MNGRGKGSVKPILILIAIIALLLLLGRSAESSGSVLASTLSSVLKFVLWAGIIILILLVLFVVLIIVSVSKDGKKGKGKESGKQEANQEAKTEETGSANTVKLTEEESEILKKGNKNLLELRKLVSGIQNGEIKKGSNEICLLFENTLRILKQKPDRITNARQCLNYYIPTFGEILQKYRSLESNNVLTDDITQKVEKYLGDIRTSLTTLNTKLFEDDKLDMSVDMEAMTIAFKRDGLLQDSMALMDLKL